MALRERSCLRSLPDMGGRMRLAGELVLERIGGDQLGGITAPC
jgi:hypothetical protein